MSKIILVRHATSTWNEQGLWTGRTDVPLSTSGEVLAARTAEALRGISIDVAFSSALTRARHTLEILQRELGLSCATIADDALNERDYGVYTGLNKWDVQKQVGDDEFKKLRRGWDHPIPQGETLKNVFDRVVPFYERAIRPRMSRGETVLVVGHGNSLRALMKRLEGTSDVDAHRLEIRIGEIVECSVTDGIVVQKEIRGTRLDDV